jgi:hypothetical protein
MFVESKEGFTYVRTQIEGRTSSKIMVYLYGDKERDENQWKNSVK